MINISTTDFYIAVPSLPRGEFKEYSTLLFDDWENHIEGVLKLSDYSLSLNVEEGSIKAKAKIAATTLGVLYLAIGQYGSFITGVQTINDQARIAGDYFGQRAGSPFKSSGVMPRLRKKGESLASLQKLFDKIQKGEMTVEEAMLKVEKIFGPEVESAPDFMLDVKESFEKTPLFAKQMQLPLENIEGDFLLPSMKNNIKKPTRREPTQNHDQYRVEVWRESKKSERNVRVVSLE